MSDAKDIYALSIDQCVNALLHTGHLRTMLVEGHMGTGKSSMLPMLAAVKATHMPCYFDCTTKDLGDITIPNIAHMDDGSGYVQYLTNEELGAHHHKPVLLMIDEYGKANTAVKNSLLRLMLERKIGGYTLHPDSIIFATTNLGAENVGDMLPPHARNRLVLVRMKKPTADDYIAYGIRNDFDLALLGFVKEYKTALFQDFTQVKDPDDNLYIFHPRQERRSFFTPRSGHAASDVLKQRHNLDDHTLTALLMGAVGERTAMDLMAFVKIGDQLPSLESLKNNPKTAVVPDSTAAVCMVVTKALMEMSNKWIDAWMDYMVRLDTEAQGMFVNQAIRETYQHRKVVVANGKFTDWAVANNYLFSADKK